MEPGRVTEKKDKQTRPLYLAPDSDQNAEIAESPGGEITNWRWCESTLRQQESDFRLASPDISRVRVAQQGFSRLTCDARFLYFDTPLSWQQISG